jgi:hypothetical protein
MGPKPYEQGKGYEWIDKPCPHENPRTSQLATLSKDKKLITIATCHICRECGNFWYDPPLELETGQWKLSSRLS